MLGNTHTTLYTRWVSPQIPGAFFQIPWVPPKRHQTAPPNDFNNLCADAIFAPGITYSRFERIFAGTAVVSGMSFGNGWINYVENCRFSGNGIALEIYNSVNGWVR